MIHKPADSAGGTPQFPGPPDTGGSTSGARNTNTACGRRGSVWPAAPEADHPEAETLPGWLLGAIVKIVALYTQPGQRVLLLAPPHGGARGTTEREFASCCAESGSGLLTGLTEAAQSAASLGRTLHVRAAHPAGATLGAGTDVPKGPQSVPRLAPTPAYPTPTPTDPPHPTGPTGAAGPGPDRFDAVITFVSPRATDWVATTAWSALLSPSGTLSFITHSDREQGRLIDPSGVLTDTAHRAGLSVLDRVVLLEVPIRRSALATSDLPAAAGSPPAQADTAGPPHTRIHHDLLLFTRSTREATVTTPEEEGR
ncbi:hypothetical protein DVA86_31430 [Streptomyces armeniacus]|uniref:Uncharacterized protein n=1 Tax=Streptomyces armeniacus TaxID=83291 RepID=A0A345XXR2_9ACTN|nr:hypothetical protein [Streptomyces armeniacus]AXK36428.1 hypothetical protein DVA86_31430 [Streptomyces armeniacus]